MSVVKNAGRAMMIAAVLSVPAFAQVPRNPEVPRVHEVLEVPVTTDTVFWNLNDPQAYAEAVAAQ